MINLKSAFDFLNIGIRALRETVVTFTFNGVDFSINFWEIAISTFLIVVVIYYIHEVFNG